MAKTNDAVMNMVRAELQKNPSAGSGELYEKAKKMNRAIGRLSVQQFHARYPLPVLRERAAKRKRGATGAKTARGGRRKAAGKTGRQPRKGGRRRRSATAPQAAPAATAAAPAGTRTTPSAGTRANVQEVLLQFAGVVATADKADMVQLMLRMDSWVDRVMEAAG